MTNGEKFKEVFQISQTDDCDLNVYVWLPIHDAIEIPVEWWNAEYKEPFDNRPCISSGVCEHDKQKVLDKIRAEIIENSIEDYKYHGCGTDELIIETSEVLEIIDRYKAESEEVK